jgi:hypothetical protein
MRKLIGVLLVLTAILLLIGCTSDKTIEASLDEEFTLAIGQTASISSENLKIKFLDVPADSRCPKDVQCPWAGEVTCSFEITSDGATEQVTMTLPGLNDVTAGQTFGNYRYKFTVEPYPESTKEIEKEDYRVKIRVSIKLPALTTP